MCLMCCGTDGKIILEDLPRLCQLVRLYMGGGVETGDVQAMTTGSLTDSLSLFCFGFGSRNHHVPKTFCSCIISV